MKLNIALFANYNPVSLSSIVFRTLKEMGHEVILFTPNPFKAEQVGIIACEAFVDVPKTLNQNNFKADLILFVESSIAPLLFPLNIEQLKIPTCWWGIDNHMNYRWHKNYLNLFDHSFFAMKNFAEQASRYSKNMVHWLPLACDPEIHKDYNLERSIPCSFVANLNPRREKLVHKIAQLAPLQHYSGLSQLEMARKYAASVTGFNLAIREDLNMRVFEIMASGAALITQDIPFGLRDLFNEGEHYIAHNVDNAADIINSYSNDAAYCKSMGEKASQLVREHHSYQKRLEEVINQAGSLSDKGNIKEVRYHRYMVLNHRHYKAGLNNSITQSLKHPSLIWFIKDKLENFRFKIQLMLIKKF